MEINTDDMIAKQNKMNAHIANTEPIKEVVDTVCYVEKVMPTKSHLIEYDGGIVITRYMFNNIYRVSFNIDIKVIDILPYMDLDDKSFIKVSDK